MMEHIRQFDWCSSTVDRHFVEQSDLDNCVTEKILRNKFYDPLISSDSENEAPNVIDWVDIYKKRESSAKSYRMYIPGLRGLPPFPKVSALTAQQHLQCLKVLCADNPHILEAEFMPRPTKQDHKVFEEVKEIYAKEQIEFKEWAKSLWKKGQCVRALRPAPAVEAAYSAEHALRRHAARALPAAYRLAAQIPLAPSAADCDLTHVQDLIDVNVADLPEVRLPETIVKRFNIIRPRAAPTPCIKHPCRFVLPNESSMSVLPLPELQRALAQFAREHGAAALAGEGALKCLLQPARRWTLPLAVCDVMGPEGEMSNVLVLGSEFSINKEPAITRTYRAFRHLLEYAAIPVSERMKVQSRSKNADVNSTNNDTIDTAMLSDDTDTDEDRDDLYIDTDFDKQNDGMEIHDTEIIKDDEDKENGDTESSSHEQMESNGANTENTVNEKTNGYDEVGVGFYSCTCKDYFLKPPPRSYKKWQVKAKNTGDKYDIIVHCSHKARSGAGEVYLEPAPQYQAELAAAEPTPDQLRSAALSLLLRPGATLLDVRVDAMSGDVLTCEAVPLQELRRRGGDVTAAAGVLHAALQQLQGLRPGHYVLQHEPAHGSNALLFAAGGAGGAAAAGGGDAQLRLDAAPAPAAASDAAPPPPELGPALLPVHKHRKLLPCAFSPQGAAPGPRRRPPPPAIKWPKRKQKKKKTAH